MFELFPAVDIAHGRAVRLVRGKSGTETDYGDPRHVAQSWADQGATWLHVVDLDAAMGKGSNSDIIRHLISDLGHRVRFEVSGGLRDSAAISAAFKMGASRVNIGTAAFTDPDWVRSVIDKDPNRIAIALDVRDHTITGHGWTTDDGDLWESIGRLDAAGCQRYVLTDVNRDGTGKGPNLHLIKKVCEVTGASIVASGGIGHLSDLHKLAELASVGVEGAVVGRALYDGAFTLAEALASLEARFDPYEWGPARP